MAGYVIADVNVTNAAAYEEYRKLVPASIQKYGGKYLVRGGKHEKLEGTWTPSRLVVIEFESVEQARRWYLSDEYRRAKEVRQRTALSNVIIVEGA
ncbi:MAG: DUF1330 domain-containing protein [Candidatus Rokubacteria bacterium]|nr:DUF1330 domain-containing protein [Candidatus Rokubacteria bacterium]